MPRDEDMRLGAGTRLGSYEILSGLGAGGMGEVYRAADTVLKRQVALKVLPPQVADDPDRVARFQREAEVLASLNHPNIAHLYGIEKSNGTLALVMELVEGATLADRIATEPIPVDEALLIAKQIAQALEAAHEQGIVHRDLKPANVKVRDDGTVKVLDFGLAKAMEPRASVVAPAQLTNSPTITSPALMTGVGVLLGTAAYMSPEQAKGRAADKRSDMWAFGCVLFEMLVGRRAFDGEDVSDTLANVLKTEPDWTALPPELPNNIRALLQSCLTKDRSARAADASIVRYVLAEHPSGLTPARTFERTSRRRLLTALVGGIAAGTASAAAVTWFVVRPPATTPRQLMRFAVVPPAAQSLVIGADRAVDISPDGKYIAYVGGSGQAQLFVRPIDHLEATPLPGIAEARGPFFSPDSRWIGFFTANVLNKVSISGGPTVPVCTTSGAGPRGASWGPDNTIIFATVGSDRGLMSVPAGGGEPKMLTRPDTAHGETGHYFPTVTPDGKSVLFSILHNNPRDTQIAVLDLKTGTHKTLIQGGSNPRFVQGGYLVYTAGDSLRAVRFDAERLQVVGEAVPLSDSVTISGPGAAEYSVSQTGTLLHVPAGAANLAARSLVWIDREGHESAISAPPRGYVIPRISPDGTRVALDVRDTGADIWIWDLARQSLMQLTTDRGPHQYPVWSPDGQLIVYDSVRSGVPNLFWQRADGTGRPARLTTSSYTQNPTAFNGKNVVFTQIGPSQDVMVLHLGMVPPPSSGEFKSDTLVGDPAANELNAELSPDGRWLAYQSNASGRDQIIVQPFPNVQDGRWTVSGDGGTRPAWSRDGKELVYVDPTSALVAVPIQTTPTFRAGNPVKLFDWRVTAASTPGRFYDIAPDGRRFLMIKDRPADPNSAGMLVTLNWADELKAKFATP